MKTLTEEDYARIRAEAQAVRDRAMGLSVETLDEDVTSEEKPKKTPRPKTPGKPRLASTVYYPKYSREKIKKLFLEGQTAPEIAKEMQCHKQTVYRILDELGLKPITSKSGPARKSHCKNNHDLSVHGRELPKGGRECMECKRDRAREWWRKNRGVQKQS